MELKELEAKIDAKTAELYAIRSQEEKLRKEKALIASDLSELNESLVLTIAASKAVGRPVQVISSKSIASASEVKAPN